MRLFNEVPGDGADGGTGSDSPAPASSDPGAGASPWHETLPQDLREAPAVYESKDLESFVRQGLAHQAEIGRRIRVPGDDASPEDRQSFYEDLGRRVGSEVVLVPEGESRENAIRAQLGVPAEANGYEMPDLNGHNIPEDRIAWMQNLSHEAGLTPAQFTRLVEASVENQSAQMTAAREALEAGRTALRQEWGDANHEKMGLAERGLQIAKQWNPDLESVTTAQLSAGELRMLSSMAEAMGSEGATLVNEAYEARRGLTVQEAQAKIWEIRNDQNHPYNQQLHPMHEAAKEEMHKLYLITTPGERPLEGIRGGTGGELPGGEGLEGTF